MTSLISILSAPTGRGTLDLGLHPESDTGSSVVLRLIEADQTELGTERFCDINSALRAFFHRLRSGNPEQPSPAFSIPTRRADVRTVSASVEGLRDYCRSMDEWDATSPAYHAAADALRVRDQELDLTPEDIACDVLSQDIAIIDHTLEDGRTLALVLAAHPFPEMQTIGEKALVVRLEDQSGNGSDHEYFFDIGLAFRSFVIRRDGPDSGVTRTGMEYRTGVSHYENRNLALGYPVTSISKDMADVIARHMLMSSRIDDIPLFYFVLADTIHAAFGGHKSKWLGPVTVMAAGDGHYAVQSKPVTLSLLVDVSPEMELDEDGSIAFANCSFRGFYDYEEWHDPELRGRDLLYTDSGIRNGVNEFLSALGYRGCVDWSEHGRQSIGECDFDMDYALIHQIFPPAAE